DGVHSPLRRALGLDVPARRRRVGMRAHFRLAPGVGTDPWVDVLLGDGHELYVTALPRGELLVAALADAGTLAGPPEAAFARWCAAQPFLADRLRGAERLTPLRGVAPPTPRPRPGGAPVGARRGGAARAPTPVAPGGGPPPPR